MRLEISIDGDISKLMASEFRAGERAVSTAMRIAGDGLKADWRSQVVAAGFGVKLSKAVRSEVFPKGQASMSAAALVYTKSPKIIAAHESGALITSKNGFWLAIPLPAAGKGRGGRRITPAEWEAKSNRRLKFIYRRGRTALLVDDGSQRQGHARAFGQSKTRTFRNKVIPIFALVPQVKLPKRLNLMAAGSAAQARVPGLIVSNWKGAV